MLSFWAMGRLQPEKLVYYTVTVECVEQQADREGSVKMRHFRKGVDGVIDGDANQAAPLCSCCILSFSSPDCCVGPKNTTRRCSAVQADIREIILESRQAALKMARRLTLMHAGARYHARRKLSSPTALPACVSAGSPAKRGNMISWLFCQVSC